MIRKIIYLPFISLLIGLCTCFIQSCNYLDIDQYINDMQSLDTVFQKKGLTEQFLYNVYSYLPSPGQTWDGDNPKSIPWILCADEAFNVEPNGVNNFCNNIFTSNNKEFTKWKRYYEGIRNASIFIKRAPECKELNTIQLREYIGEAQFLKAYFYFELMKQYGPICLVPEDGFTLEQPIEEILIARNSWDECVDYVNNLLEEAAQKLPDERPSSDFGKPTSGAALAARSRLLLYSASPLFNGNTSYADFKDKKTGINYINQIKDESKWAVAALAAKEVINKGTYKLMNVPEDEKTPALPKNVVSDPDFYNQYPNGAAGIDHYLSYANMFNGSVSGSKNTEIIFAMPGIEIDRYCGPNKMRGYSSYNVTQKLVDAYYMINGKTIEEGGSDPDYPYTTEKSSSSTNFSGYILPSGVYGWYLNREMRFYATIGFNRSYYIGSSSPRSTFKNFEAEFHSGGNCTDAVSGTWMADRFRYCMTGYLCRKFQNPEDVFGGSYYGSVKPKVWIDYRLAEIYLNYVEALNELTGSHTIGEKTVSRDPSEIKKYFNMIRYRAGLPGITLSDADNAEKVRQLIRKECQIELAWEGHRYFDVRRWKIAIEEENDNVTGMAVNKKEDDGFYRVVQVKEVAYAYKRFSSRKNFWPIPQTEITKNTNIVQNPGWE
ncbi:RagB/SusD family nutrient uptake outer membrane protein [Bacteroides bouchesdurhonensis]|uniref:RagB/SusD family nutrient uptake outer membrane protein n=1 Tax=Bacteroides bouchesdurhonensis TaxID=1841855 RepID=UPI0009FA75AB|nr:RagB/SusD family nutrient uptake outer membrane protein [Bacteroides bouchesdurhonensis]